MGAGVGVSGDDVAVGKGVEVTVGVGAAVAVGIIGIGVGTGGADRPIIEGNTCEITTISKRTALTPTNSRATLAIEQTR